MISLNITDENNLIKVINLDAFDVNLEEKYDTDLEEVIATERYEFIEKVKKKTAVFYCKSVSNFLTEYKYMWYHTLCIFIIHNCVFMS